MRKILLLSVVLSVCSRRLDAFSPSPRFAAAATTRQSQSSSTAAKTTTAISMSDDSGKNENQKDADSSSYTFDDAARAIRDEEDAEALARGSGMSEEEEAEYTARSDEFTSMKDRIRSRASELGVEKSVATAEAIKQAELRAKNMASSSADLDMSVFEKRLLSNPEDELTDEEMAEIDPVGEKSFFEQAMDEFNNTKLPGPLDVAKTVGFMFVIFVVSAFVILKSDEFLRQLYTDLGFIPAPDAKLNYDNLVLPKDWEKDLNDLSGVFEAATKTLGVKVPEAPTLNVDVPSDL